MPKPASRQTPRKRSVTWAITPLALVIYASAAMVALGLELQVPVPAPWWAVAPPLIYALVAVIAVRRRSAGRLLGAVGALCAVHALLLVGTAVAVSYITPGVAPPFMASTLSALLVVGVPLMLAPFRPRHVVRPRQSRGAAGNAGSAPAGAQRRATAAAPAPAAAPSRGWPAPPRAAQAAAIPLAAAIPAPAAPAASVFAPAPVAAPPPPASPEPPRAASPPPPPKPVEPAPARMSVSPGAEAAPELIRISFERVAEQLPADIFAIPREEVGARLIEADCLLVPEHLVRPQLAEGHVEVGWSVVAEQFPREVLAMSQEEIARRLLNGNLMLPLDEVIRQIPPGMFAVPTSTLDVGALEEFPPPFQPFIPAPATPESASASDAEPSPIEPEDTLATPAYEPEPFTEESELPADEPAPPAPLVYEPDAAANEPEPIAYEPNPVAYEPNPVAYEPNPVAYEPASVTLEPEPDSLVAELEAAYPEAVLSAWDLEPRAVEPAVRAPVPAPRVPEPAPRALEPPPPAPEPPARAPELAPPPPMMQAASSPASDDAARAADARRMAALLGPLLSPVTAERCERPGATFFTLAPPALAGPMVTDVAAGLLPFLTDARLPEPAQQATVRAAAMTVVVTPLAGAPSWALAAATTAGASLALLERLCLRAAAVPVAQGRGATPLPASASDVDFQETAPEPTVRAVAESLQAFGPVTPTVLRDPDGALILYLFLPRGLAPRTLGGFARDVHRALGGSPAGALASVIFRVGTRRLLLRAVDGARGTVLVAGGGTVDRPGMARLELERAASRLGQL